MPDQPEIETFHDRQPEKIFSKLRDKLLTTPHGQGNVVHVNGPPGPTQTEEDTMNATTATAFITTNKGLFVTITKTDGTMIDGFALSVNSKGVNVKDDDGKTFSVALARVASIDLADADYDGDQDGDSDDDNGIYGDDTDEGDDEDTDEDIYAELGDGMTTAELAAHLSDALTTDLDAKALRVHLRALGLGVGKGRKYSLTATEFRLVRDLVKTNA